MPKLMPCLSMLAVLSIADVAGAAMPVGIPDPAGKVPSAIMPVLPTSNAQIPAFPYDPINIPTPKWSNAANQYYVDSSSNACSDSANSGRGSPDAPRCSLPGLSGTSWTLADGAQVFIVGDGATYGGSQDVNSADMRGTASAPIWIIGVGNEYPELRFSRFFWTQGTHVIFDSVHFAEPNDNFRMSWSDATGPVEYFTFRHVECSGSDGDQSSVSRRCFSFGGTSQNVNQFVVLYDVDIHGFGHWQDDWTTSTDMHGIQMQKWSRYIWVLNSRIYHMQGDGIQCGNSQWFDYDRASRPHYIYVANTEFYENYEQAYDQKGCYHVVFSSNDVHTFYNRAKGANETAIITEQDSEGDVGGRFGWFINNLVEDSGTGFAAKATTDDAYVYILGNVIRDVSSSAFDFTQRCYKGGSAGETCPLGLTFAQNTIDCGTRGATGITNVQNPVGSHQDVEIDGNIWYNCQNGHENSDQNWESFSEEPLNLKHVQNVHFRTTGGNISLPTGRYDVLSDNVLNQNVGFTNAANGDYSLSASSPAVGLVKQQNGAYALFESMYGLDIRVDRGGHSWGGGQAINAGAYQSGSSSPAPQAPRPEPPTLSVL